MRLAPFSLLLFACLPTADGVSLPDGSPPDGSSPDSAREPNTLEVWTWNLERFPHAIGAPEQVADILDAREADIVGFQEIDEPGAFDDLLAELPGWSGVTGELGFGIQVALAFRVDRIRLLESEHLFTADSFAFPRPVLAVTLEVIGHPELGPIKVVVVHLKARIDSESEERRRVAVEKLEAWAAEQSVPLLMVGDWNDELGDVEADNVFLPFLEQPGRYTALTNPLDAEDEYSYIPFRRLIDHVIANRAASELLPVSDVEAVALELSIANYEDDLSDHRPVRTRHRVGQ